MSKVRWCAGLGVRLYRMMLGDASLSDMVIGAIVLSDQELVKTLLIPKIVSYIRPRNSHYCQRLSDTIYANRLVTDCFNELVKCGTIKFEKGKPVTVVEEPMLNFEFVITRLLFSIEMTVEQFKKINNWGKWEQIYDEENETYSVDQEWEFQTGIAEAGAIDIDYSGHFGSFIFFSLDKDDEFEENKLKITQFLNEYFSEEDDENS